MLPQAYLTDRQLKIWRLRQKNISQSEVGRKLGITRQSVYEAENISFRKVESALRDAAEVNMIEVNYIDATNGVLLGLNPVTRNRVIVTFSAVNGIRTWHHEEPNCSQCMWTGKCRGRLLMEAEERSIEVPKEKANLTPNKLAHFIFSRMIPGLEG